MTTAQIAAEELGASQIQAPLDEVPVVELTTAEPQSVWQAPTYGFSRSDRSGSARKASSSKEQSLIRTARWCMDGSTIMTTSEDRSIRLYSVPENVGSSSLVPYLDLPQPAPILSSLWYPTATPSIPEGFCFAAAIRDSPVRLIDAATGLIRATYPIVDHRERFIAPHSMAWNPSATKLYCGHENAIEVLDISAPGYDAAERIKTTQTRGDKGGQKGIISALAFSTDYSGMYAAGSFGGSVSLYSEDESGTVGHLEGVEGGGVTQLGFHPLSPNHLFVASRRSSQLQVFDLRNPSEPFHLFPRSANTNQRMSFDLDPWGRYLAFGDEKGIVSVWDVAGEGKWGERLWESQVALKYDAVSSVQFHPLRPLLLVSSGSRHIMDMSDSDSEGSSDEDTSEEDEGLKRTEDGGAQGDVTSRRDHRGAGPQLGILDFSIDQ